MKETLFNYICKVCGKIQEPTRTDGDWQVYDTKCSECGGELTIQLEKKGK